jgi:sporulation protein YlmC with PRC-barrel domain
MDTKRQLAAMAVALTFAGTVAAQTGATAATDSPRGTASPAVTSPPGGAAVSTAPAAAATHELQAVRLSKLEGVNIYDADSKRIGEVEDLVLEPGSGRVLHALVSIGGVMGVGDKRFAVPTRQLRAFSRSAEEGIPMKVSLDAAPDSLTPAKKLDKDSPYVMGTKLIGTDVNDSAGKEAGEIEDLIVDLRSGEVRIALVEFDKSWSVDDKLFAFQMSELKQDKEGKKLAVNVTRESLAQTPSIEKSRLDKVDLRTQPWMQAAGNRSPDAGTAGATTAERPQSTKGN